MFNFQLDPFVAELIKTNDGLKKAYEAWLFEEIRLRELNTKSNYNNLKMQLAKGKQKKEDELKKGKEVF